MEIKNFFVKPYFPEKLRKLYALSQNIWSYWDKDAEKLFSRIDTIKYSNLNHSLTELIQTLKEEDIEALADNSAFVNEMNKVWEKFSEYMEFEGQFRDPDKTGLVPFDKNDVIAYFSMEYGLHESLPIYSGGLGVLSGDYLKAASDVGIPLVGFGLLYRFGYFSQRINFEGFQEEEYREINCFTKPIKEVKDKNGTPLIIKIRIKEETIHIKVWTIQVGKIPLYLMDTNLESNSEEMRRITDRLYDADRNYRFLQELVLGRGSIVLIKTLGIRPRIYHINEGHSAFLIFERMKYFIKEKGYSYEDAMNIIRHDTIFTTHTPVIEGNEHYSVERVLDNLKDEFKELGLTKDEFLELGLVDDEKTFWLPAFSIRFSRFINGVSRLHSKVSQRMWKKLFPQHLEPDVPIGYVTNGVHVQTWLSMEMTQLFDRYLGPDYLHRAESEEVWQRVFSAPDSEIWAAHTRRKQQLISFIRNHTTKILQEKGGTLSQIEKVGRMLNPKFLTIGFARRFAPYKRAQLIFNNPERLVSILKNPERPVQIIFAGKAHPADVAGKKLIKQILDFAKQYDVEDRVVFVENYNLNIAKHLVQGVDVWLNTPLKPLEASGTSGMKAGVNGVLNFSVRDGWWDECYDGENGWAITAGDKYSNYDMKLAAEANQVYDLLEDELTPIFYERNDSDVPEEWVERMKKSIYTVGKGFNMHRMIREYFYKYYLKETKTIKSILHSEEGVLEKLKAYKKKVDAHWENIYIKEFNPGIELKTPSSGDTVKVSVISYLDGADESDYSLELVYNYSEDPGKQTRIKMEFIKKLPNNLVEHQAHVTLKGAGVQSLSVKLCPTYDLFRQSYPNYIKWK